MRVVPCCRACVRAREGASEGGRKRGRARAREGESERLREGKRGSERAREGGREGGTSEEGRREGRVHGKRGPARASPCMDTRRTEKRSSSELFKFFRSIFVLKPKFFNCVETKIVLAYFARGYVSTGGPTASRPCQNSRSAGAAAPEGYAGGSAGLKSTVGQLLSCVGQVRQHFRNTAVNGSCYGNAPVVFGWQVLACFTFVLMQGTPIEA